MSAPSEYFCQACANKKNQKVGLVEIGKDTDNEGFLVSKLMCPGCGVTGQVRVVEAQPPCERCGHQKRAFVRGGATTYRPGMGAPTDGNEFLKIMKSQSIPGAG